MGVKLAAASGGSVELVPTNTASNFTLTVPAATTTVVGTDTTQTLTNKTLTSPSLTTPTVNSAQVATVSGTAPLYMCRAWVSFQGSGTVSIRASGNVSSVTDLGVGSYTVNFTTAMPDGNYSVAFSFQRVVFPLIMNAYSYGTGGLTFECMTSDTTKNDPDVACVSIFR